MKLHYSSKPNTAFRFLRDGILTLALAHSDRLRNTITMSKERVVAWYRLNTANSSLRVRRGTFYVFNPATQQRACLGNVAVSAGTFYFRHFPPYQISKNMGKHDCF